MINNMNSERKIRLMEILNRIMKNRKLSKNVSRRLYPICTAEENQRVLLLEWTRIHRIECMQYDFDFINETQCYLESN